MKLFEGLIINITYTLKSGKTHKYRLKPEKFFDIENENKRVDTFHDLVWKNNHAIDYLDNRANKNDVIETTLSVYSTHTKESIKDCEFFWGNGQGWSLTRKESLDNKVIYQSLIININTSDGTHILKFSSNSSKQTKLEQHNLILKDKIIKYIFP